MKKLLVFLLIFLLPGWACAWQQVVVQYELDEQLSLREALDRALETGFRKAVSQEVDRIVPGQISQERKTALMNHIGDKIGGLVQGYRRAVQRQTDTNLVLDVEVNIDSASLRKALQKAGVYYTSLKPWTYDLNTRGASPEDFSYLRELQLITGTLVEGASDTSLNLSKSADGEWKGSIVHKSINMSSSGYDLGHVWFDLWEYFFSRPEIQSVLVKNLVLLTSGWPTTDSIMNFDRVLRTWDMEVEHSEVIAVKSGINSLDASWEIRTISPDLLQERLNNYLKARGIDYHADY